MTSVKLLHHAFFEKQEGKTWVDQHFSTVERGFKRHHQQRIFSFAIAKIVIIVCTGKDIASVDDIMSSASTIEFTTMHKLTLDRESQQLPPTALQNVTRWSDFEYVYNSDQCIGIQVREQSFMGKGIFFSHEELDKLWPDKPQATTNSLLFTCDNVLPPHSRTRNCKRKPDIAMHDKTRAG